MQTTDNATGTAQPIERLAGCPQCGSSSTLFRTSGDVNDRSSAQVFHYHRCEGCDLIFMSDVPADMAPFYRKGYQPLPANVDELRALAAGERFRLEELLKFKRGGKLLEIGPWIGIFSINAKDAGFEVEAIENDANCVEFLTRSVGIKAYQSGDPAAVLGDMTGRYDAIVLWHSLEHLPTPWRVIENAAKALKPGGVLLVAIPNIDGYDSRVMREKWLHLDAPRHLYFYPAAALSSLCGRFGLVPRQVSTSDRLSTLLAIAAWHHYARRLLPVKYARGILGRLLWWKARSKQMQEGLGSGLTAIFYKGEGDADPTHERVLART